MDIWQAIKADHDKVKSLFEAIQEEEAGKRERLVAELKRELEAHAQGEEKAVYPELAKVEELADAIDHSRDEHAEMRQLLQQIEEATPDEQMDLIAELEEVVQDHVEEEEEGILPIAEKAIATEDAEAMLQQFEAAKKAVAQS